MAESYPAALKEEALKLCLTMRVTEFAKQLQDPVALTVSGAITRVTALPVVDEILKRFAPWLASEPKD
ncbi:hypothetical protein QF031_000954 [Pseudarthrobacter defluvii]|uniref:hypothetical protein n=1 Tax=Pseudarthrobacter defluvii TaxID=410837 RepID=UPI00277D8ABF|nr:hypothetical protein [Pseudarthrobacter defluvii]MDQ0768205.1 hypothetical protein [Pseudarthrobacter defluvii]